MQSEKSFCINCMNEISVGADFCPHCGHRVNDYIMNQRALKPLTILNGKYLVGKVLGEGGFGITYLGMDLVLNHKVAIKEFFPSQFASRNVYESNSSDIIVIGGKASEIFKKRLERYEAEARCLAKIESLPGIVRVLNFFYENKTAYMIMEFLSGETLKEYSKRNNARIHWKEATDIMEPIIKSLAILHKNSIIHRDISPDNIMITDEGNLVLIDFGTAVEIEEDDKSKAIELKLGYAPPEQYSSHGNQGPWTDVYEVCATIYFLISGETLPDALAISQNTAKIVPLKDYDHTIPPDVESAIMKGLNPDIKERIGSMDELGDYLYYGRKIFPKRKIITAVCIVASVAAILSLFVVAAAVITDKIRSQATIEATSEADTASREEEKESSADKVPSNDGKDTAAEYVKKKGLSYTADDLFTYTENGNGITVTGSDSSLTIIVIPETIDGKTVTAISGIGKNVTDLVLPDTLTLIGKSAFNKCVYLETLYIPASVVTIEDGAFEDCLSLSNIIISGDNKVFHVDEGIIVDDNGKE